MEKLKLKNLPLIYPIPAVLIGAVVDAKPNYATVGNCGIISVEPAVVYASLNKKHYTNKGIQEHDVFSVNIPSANLMVRVDYCGIISGNEQDKSEVFQTFYGENDKVPLVQECPINLVCKVIKSFDVHEMVVYIGEITCTYASKNVLSDKGLDTKKVNPLIYCMDNMYWDIGSIIGCGFSEGEKYK